MRVDDNNAGVTFALLTGVTPVHATNRSLFDFVHGDDLAATVRLLHNQGVVQVHIQRARHSAGTYIARVSLARAQHAAHVYRLSYTVHVSRVPI
jgi:ABC-type phosphate/phosphonate transport system ATPase subunit